MKRMQNMCTIAGARRLKYARSLSALSVPITKPIRVQAYIHWIAIPGVGRNPESVRAYLHEMFVSHEHTYKRDNI